LTVKVNSGLTTFHTRREQKMARTAFVDIDTQHDFMRPGGALYIAGAEKIVGNLERLFKYAVEKGVPLISSMDAHRPDDPEFSDFPAHCVKGSPGQRKISETLLPGAIVVPAHPGALPAKIPPGAQVIFDKPTLYIFDNPNFMEHVRRERYDTFIVFGVATDYCIRIVAEGLVERGLGVTVVTDAIAAVVPEAGEKALESMRRAGVKFATTGEVTR
jgi:nicotinamidase/pyrazinamidase